MTDRIKGFYVSLDRDYRDDDVQTIVDAVSMIKGVSDVETSVCEVEDYYARARVFDHFKKKMYEALSELNTDTNLCERPE